MFAELLTLSYTDTGSPDDVMTVPFPARRYPIALTGTNYYVAKTGSDAANGLTLGTPKLTIGAAIGAAAASGDTINVRAGTYEEGDFASTKAFTLQNYDGERVVMDGRNTVSSFSPFGVVWRASFTSPARPTVSGEQANMSQAGGANPSFPTDKHCIYAMPVTRDGVLKKGRKGASWTPTSITRSGSTATVTTAAAHEAATGESIRIAGANQAEYNGTFVVTVTGTSTFTYTVTGTPVTPATGTITWSDLVAGTYFWDYANNFLYVGDDPTGATVRASKFERAFNVLGTCTIRGIVFRCYGANYGGTQAAIITSAANCVLENCIVGYTAADGFLTSASGGTYRDCHALQNLTGWSANSTMINTTFRRCLSYKNNVFWSYVQDWHGGGFKNADVDGFLYYECVARENRSSGFWFDYSGDNNSCVNCLSLYNVDKGFIWEKCTAANNTTLANRMLGCVSHGNYQNLNIFGSAKLVVRNCTFVNSRQMINTDDSRTPTHNNNSLIFDNNIIDVQPGHTVVAGTQPIEFYASSDNLLSGATNATTWYTTFNHTAWHHASNSGLTITNEIAWWTGASVTPYATRTQFNTAQALDANGIRSTAAGSPWLTAPNSFDWSQVAASGVIGVGGTLPANEVALLGPRAGRAGAVAPNLGAFTWPGKPG